MATYTLLLFGICRDLLKKDEISIETPALVDAETLLSITKNTFPELSHLPSLRLAADHHFPKSDFIIEERMEIALIPPVSGG
jgi:molybdopterin synthase sulfur carrier subunit